MQLIQRIRIAFLRWQELTAERNKRRHYLRIARLTDELSLTATRLRVSASHAKRIRTLIAMEELG